MKRVHQKVIRPTKGHIAYDTVMVPSGLSHGSGGSTPGISLFKYTVRNVTVNIPMP